MTCKSKFETNYKSEIFVTKKLEKFDPEKPKCWQILTFKNQNFDKKTINFLFWLVEKKIAIVIGHCYVMKCRVIKGIIFDHGFSSSS